MKKYLIIAVLSCYVIGARAQDYNTPANKLRLAEFAITNLYVDKVDENKIVEDAIVKMLSTLDPHSIYSDPEEVKKLNEPLQGNFDGIGVQFNMVEDTLLVIQPVAGGPSQKVGIQAGDRIVMVNDTVIAGVKMKTEGIMNRLRGPKGTKVNLRILRRGEKNLLDFTVTRDRIPIYSIDASYMVDDQTGYIRISRFAATTHKEFVKDLLDLQKRGMKNLILDLQDNGGGYLSAAIDMANEFLESKNEIVYTKGRTQPKSDWAAQGNGLFRKGKLVVLINEFSASASEILTGAIQDWDRGIIVGRRSFGKGLVQRPIDLPDGSMIRLTVARYYTPSGRCIQKPYENIEKYNEDLIDRYNRGEMSNADSIHFPDSLKYYTKQLSRVVYGGGGIMPDYFVPIDTTVYSDYYRKIANKGIVFNYTIRYTENNKSAILSKYKDFKDFEKNFDISESDVKAIVDEANKAGIKYDEKQLNTSMPLLKMQFKALVARDIWDMNEYYEIYNADNENMKKALQILSDGGYEMKLNKNRK
jgi:carboxyl-terminal processing protease